MVRDHDLNSLFGICWDSLCDAVPSRFFCGYPMFTWIHSLFVELFSITLFFLLALSYFWVSVKISNYSYWFICFTPRSCQFIFWFVFILHNCRMLLYSTYYYIIGFLCAFVQFHGVLPIFISPLLELPLEFAGNFFIFSSINKVLFFRGCFSILQTVKSQLWRIFPQPWLKMTNVFVYGFLKVFKLTQKFKPKNNFT